MFKENLGRKQETKNQEICCEFLPPTNVREATLVNSQQHICLSKTWTKNYGEPKDAEIRKNSTKKGDMCVGMCIDIYICLSIYR